MHEIRAAFPEMLSFLRRKPLLLGALLVFATLLLYVPVLHHEFINVWDDGVYISGNPHVRSGLTSANVKWAFTTLEPFYWQPITLISHMIDCQLFGLKSGAHHYVNVLLHAANAFLLFFLLRRATGAVWRSFLVAALFALHPMNVETVAWAAERNSLLNAFFSLVTIAAYGWYVRRPGWKRYIAISAAFLLALMSKPTAVTLPLILLLLDYWPLNRYEDLPVLRRWGRLLLEKMPLVLISGGICALTVAGERSSNTVMSLSALPMPVRLENAIISYAAYIGTMLLPANLSAFYPYPAITPGQLLPLGEVAAAALVLVGITAIVFYFGANFAQMGWVFFLSTLVPMIGIIQTGSQGRQDHFTYIPCIGLFIILVWGASAVVESIRVAPAFLFLAPVCLLTGYAAATAHYLPFWQNGVELFGQARVAAGQPNPWLELNYGNALFEADRVGEAFQHYAESCELEPRNEHCHYNMAEILFDHRQYRDAIEQYQLTLMLHPSKAMALNCLNKSAEALLDLGDYEDVGRVLANALRVDPNNSTAVSLSDQLYRKR